MDKFDEFAKQKAKALAAYVIKYLNLIFILLPFMVIFDCAFVYFFGFSSAYNLLIGNLITIFTMFIQDLIVFFTVDFSEVSKIEKI